MKRLDTIAAVLAFATLALPAAAADSIPLAELDKQTHYHGLAVDPADPSRLYLATHHGFYRVGPDGTATRLSQVQDFMGFTPHPTDPSVFYASGHPSNGGNLGFLMSLDGGANWTQVSPGANGPVDFHQMDVSPADPQVIYGVYGDLQVSRDGGKNWAIVGQPPEGLIALAASATSTKRIYGATQMGLMVSDDSGATWRALAFGGQPVSMVATGPNGALYAYVVGSGLMSATEAKPETWSSLSSDPRIQLHLAIDDKDPNRLFAIAYEGGIIRSDDGGRTWRNFAEP
jgi:photosystem II stability/assembly factor-like uncharacterized protein